MTSVNSTKPTDLLMLEVSIKTLETQRELNSTLAVDLEENVKRLRESGKALAERVGKLTAVQESAKTISQWEKMTLAVSSAINIGIGIAAPQPASSCLIASGVLSLGLHVAIETGALAALAARVYPNDHAAQQKFITVAKTSIEGTAAILAMVGYQFLPAGQGLSALVGERVSILLKGTPAAIQTGVSMASGYTQYQFQMLKSEKTEARAINADLQTKTEDLRAFFKECIVEGNQSAVDLVTDFQAREKRLSNAIFNAIKAG